MGQNEYHSIQIIVFDNIVPTRSSFGQLVLEDYFRFPSDYVQGTPYWTPMS